MKSGRRFDVVVWLEPVGAGGEGVTVIGEVEAKAAGVFAELCAALDIAGLGAGPSEGRQPVRDKSTPPEDHLMVL